MALPESSSENIGLQKAPGVSDGRSPSSRSCATADRSSGPPPAAIRRIASSTDVLPELFRPAKRLMRSSRSIAKSLKRRKFFTRRFSITVAPSRGCRSRVTRSAPDCPGGSRQCPWPPRFRKLTLQGWNCSATRLQFQYQPYLPVRWSRTAPQEGPKSQDNETTAAICFQGGHRPRRRRWSRPCRRIGRRTSAGRRHDPISAAEGGNDGTQESGLAEERRQKRPEEHPVLESNSQRAYSRSLNTPSSASR